MFPHRYCAHLGRRDSIVFRAGKGAPHGPFGPLTWLGVRGAKLSALIPSIRSHLKHMPAPSAIIVHVGTNDIFSTPTMHIHSRIEESPHTIRHLLPNVRVIWSDILLRLFYYGERRPGIGQKTVYALNRHAHRLCRRLKGPMQFPTRTISTQAITRSTGEMVYICPHWATRNSAKTCT